MHNSHNRTCLMATFSDKISVVMFSWFAGCIYFIIVMQLCYSIYVTQFQMKMYIGTVSQLNCVTTRHVCCGAITSMYALWICKFDHFTKQITNQLLGNKVSINFYETQINHEPKYQSITMKQSIDQLLGTKISIKLAFCRGWENGIF